MGFKVSWINPGRLMRIRAEAPLTQSDFLELRQQMQKALSEAPNKLDFMLDLTSAPPSDTPEQSLRFMLERRGALRNSKTGRLLIVAAGEDRRLLFSSVALALRLEVFFFETESTALKFVAELAP
jgi:hypothetical protein